MKRGAEIAGLLQGAEVCCLLVDRGGQVRAASGATEEVLGHASEELVGAPLSRFLAPQGLRRLLDWLWSTRWGPRVPALTSSRHAPGRALLAMGSPDPTSEGETLLLALVQVAPGSMAGHDGFSSRLFERFPDGLLVFDRRRRVKAANRRASELFAVASGTLEGTPLSRLLPVLSVQRLAVSANPDRLPWTVTRARRVSGTEVVVEAAAVEVGGPDHDLLLVLHDLSESLRTRRVLVEIGEQERRRLGQELHDSLGQRLTGLGMLAEHLAERLAGSEAAGEAARLAGLAREVAGQARRLSRGLFPALLERGGLRDALEELGEVTQAAGVEFALESSDVTYFADEAVVATHLYRIAQEAVNNALRHAKARTITVRLTGGDRDFDLSVQDDGQGLQQDPRPRRGLGLRSLRQRAELLGAALEIGPAPGGGTLVRCWKPPALRAEE